MLIDHLKRYWGTYLSIAILFALVLSLAGCGGSSEAQESPKLEDFERPYELEFQMSGRGPVFLLDLEQDGDVDCVVEKDIHGRIVDLLFYRETSGVCVPYPEPKDGELMTRALIHTLDELMHQHYVLDYKLSYALHTAK